ncbi:hypothetical protein SAMN05428949_2476 [Chitinophaga sp. YR627]|uniref:hypothetical protein n=1 Tax=Chitinophaga sp. YR627 TaxID=1881041 RepID=UPI0008E20DE4|nr:hypothetical protein [Chitinophaga sp. YR627]SFN33658.1 hypothetical protein SAMN05428949_2476 [Chitinophaga sp. YR627]
MINMKRSIISFLMLFTTVQALAQVSMTAQVPPEGVLMKAQLWNIALVSGSEAPVNVRIMMRLIDINTNQPVLTGVTRNIPISKGAKQLQAGDVAPIEYEYLTTVTDRSPNGLLPVGNYQACYSLFLQGGHAGDLISEDCIPFAVSPIAPPLLNTPADQSILETYNPQFTWLPPSPPTTFGNLNYELLLTEVRNGESPAQAIQQNIPVFRIPSTKNLFANYPASGLSLDTGKQYAWTVIAKNGNAFAAQTDVWTFKLKSDISKRESSENSYVQLKKEQDAAIAVVTGDIYFTYTNAVNDNTIKYELLALESGNTIISSGDLAVNPGDNMIVFEIKRKFHLQNDKTYLMRVKNSRNEIYQMKFIYLK